MPYLLYGTLPRTIPQETGGNKDHDGRNTDRNVGTSNDRVQTNDSPLFGDAEQAFHALIS